MENLSAGVIMENLSVGAILQNPSGATRILFVGAAVTKNSSAAAAVMHAYVCYRFRLERPSSRMCYGKISHAEATVKNHSKILSGRAMCGSHTSERSCSIGAMMKNPVVGALIKNPRGQPQ
jgi:hypothetical protein